MKTTIASLEARVEALKALAEQQQKQIERLAIIIAHRDENQVKAPKIIVPTNLSPEAQARITESMKRREALRARFNQQH